MSVQHIRDRIKERYGIDVPASFVPWAKREILEGRSRRTNQWRADHKQTHEVNFKGTLIRVLWNPVERKLCTAKPGSDKASGNFTMRQILEDQ